MADLQSALGEVRMMLEITRKDTGKVETVEVVGFLDDEQMKELTDGSDTHDSGA